MNRQTSANFLYLSSFLPVHRCISPAVGDSPSTPQISQTSLHQTWGIDARCSHTCHLHRILLRQYLSYNSISRFSSLFHMHLTAVEGFLSNKSFEYLQVLDICSMKRLHNNLPQHIDKDRQAFLYNWIRINDALEKMFVVKFPCEIKLLQMFLFL